MDAFILTVVFLFIPESARVVAPIPVPLHTAVIAGSLRQCQELGIAKVQEFNVDPKMAMYRGKLDIKCEPLRIIVAGKAR